MQMSRWNKALAAAMSTLSIAAGVSAAPTPPAMEVTVTNTSGDTSATILPRMVEIPISKLKACLGDSRGYIVSDAQGKETVSQVTSDSLLIFQAAIEALSSQRYTIRTADTVPRYPTAAEGKIYPERADDLAWENDVIAFRIYGPATRSRGEKAYGYDIFFKYPSDRPILGKLYEPEIDPRTWQTADSLRNIDPVKADRYIESISYHVDHGLGMDCYAVGPTLGCGAMAVAYGDSILFPWCYETAVITDNGPLRFTARLTFPLGRNLKEHCEISLDCGEYLNRSRVWIEGSPSDNTLSVLAGMPRRDSSPAVMRNGLAAFAAYSDPTQGNGNGRAQTGVLAVGLGWKALEEAGHILIRRDIRSGEVIEYMHGYSWSRTRIPDMESWTHYLEDFSRSLCNPYIIEYK